MKKTLYISVIILIAFSSCKVAFNGTYRKTINSYGATVKGVQFYNDKMIILRREVKSGSAATKGGVLKMEGGKAIEYIYINPKTPGICMNDKNSAYVDITFGTNDNCTLRFWGNTTDQYYRLTDGKDYIKIGDWITYGEYRYQVTKGNDANLLFRKTNKFRSSTNIKREKGRKL